MHSAVGFIITAAERLFGACELRHILQLLTAVDAVLECMLDIVLLVLRRYIVWAYIVWALSGHIVAAAQACSRPSIRSLQQLAHRSLGCGYPS